jgi:HSP20 family protein
MAERLSALLVADANPRSTWQKSVGPLDAFQNAPPRRRTGHHFTFMERPTMLNSRTLGTSLDRMLTLNRALDQAFNGVGSRVWVPALDVAERGDAYVIHVELPGVSPEQVDVRFEQNVLTIRGTKPASFDVAAEGEVRVFAAERVHGGFERSVRLPEFVDADRIEATFTNGLLSVTVPKAQAAQPRKITIRGAEQSDTQQIAG